MIKANLTIYGDNELTFTLKGDTYEIKEKIKEQGLKWNKYQKEWYKIFRPMTDEDLDIYYGERKAPEDIQREIDVIMKNLNLNIEVEMR